MTWHACRFCQGRGCLACDGERERAQRAWHQSLQAKIAALGGAGILTAEDLPALSAACLRVKALLDDECWHTATEILAAAGVREGLRRMRELREPYARDGYMIETHRKGKSRDWLYRKVSKDCAMLDHDA